MARAKAQGWCENGSIPVVIPGTQGSGAQSFQQSYAYCTVTVYEAGTVTLASIYSDDIGTPKANPFTAASDGQWFFYADNGHYDAQFSNGGIPTPFTLGDINLFDYDPVDGITVIGLNGIKFCDQFAGATVVIKLDACIASFGAAQGLAVIPSTMGAGNPTHVVDNVRMLDLRGLSGPDENGNEAVAYLKDVLWRARWTAAPASIQNYEVLHLHAEDASGGTNSDTLKTNYTGME